MPLFSLLMIRFSLLLFLRFFASIDRYYAALAPCRQRCRRGAIDFAISFSPMLMADFFLLLRLFFFITISFLALIFSLPLLMRCSTLQYFLPADTPLLHVIDISLIIYAIDIIIADYFSLPTFSFLHADAIAFH
jgi:hypothetical protein